jgi:hypothetical protein
MTPNPRTTGAIPPKFMPQIARKIAAERISASGRQKLPNEPKDSCILLIYIGDFPWDTPGRSRVPDRWPLYLKLPNEPKRLPISLITNGNALTCTPRETHIARHGILN